MSRRIVCPKCGELKPMHPGDVAAGFKRRRSWIKLTSDLCCDYCGKDMKANEIVLAETTWQDSRTPPDLWEERYGTIQP